jgi:DNA polymerase-1
MNKAAPYKHLYLVDGSGYIFRAYFAIPPRNASDGTPTNATFGFSNMILKLLRESDADGVAVIFDNPSTRPTGPTRRRT